MLPLAALLFAAPVPPTPAPAGPPMPPADAPQWRGAGAGLKIWDAKHGDGDKVPEGDTVTVRFTVWTVRDGKVALSNLADKEPGDRVLADQIPGWKRGLLGMAVGGTRRLLLDPPLAYGAKGLPPTVPPNARLMVEVELIQTDGP